MFKLIDYLPWQHTSNFEKKNLNSPSVYSYHKFLNSGKNRFLLPQMH